MAHCGSLIKAQSLAKNVVNGVFDTEKTIAANREQAKKIAALEIEKQQEVAQKRIKRNCEIVKSDEERIRGSDEAIKQAAACIRSLQHARYAHYASAQVVDRRLQLRSERPIYLRRGQAPNLQATIDARPPTVDHHDSVNQGLISEQRLLATARQVCVDLEQQARDLVQALESVRGGLWQDAARRRHHVEQDRAYIISFNSMTVSGPTAEPPEIDEHQVQEARALCRHVGELEDAVAQTCAKSASEIKRFKAEARRARAHLEEQLMKSTYALDDLGKRLKGQAKEVDGTIRMAERGLSEIRKKNFTRNDEVGASKVVALEEMLTHLRTSRSELQEDIRCKAGLLDIDERCRKVTSTGEKLFAEKKSTFTAANKSRSLPMLQSTGKISLYQ